MDENVELEPARMFVGFRIDPVIAAQLAGFAAPLKDTSARLVAPADIHLSLVPPWRETMIERAVERLSEASGRFTPFPLRFDHIGYGPQPRRPRLLWVECPVTESIASLQSTLMKTFGQENARPFRPHLTLARIRDGDEGIARTHPINHALSLWQLVRTVELFRSPPPGATGYQIVASAPLAGKRPA
jgi:RNA 2',3'-cyclic 3'-phosphodiesterase